MRVLSLGWGVQSWTLAAMAALGEIEAVDFAIHADTGHEMSGTYAHAKKWTGWLERRGVKVITVRAEDTGVVTKGAVMIPAYGLSEKGEVVPINRQCTNAWKIQPIRKYIRTQLPSRPAPDSVSMITGISWDESLRIRPSRIKYIKYEYPLVDARITRAHCITWLQAHGLDVPVKSGCTFCPFTPKNGWKELKRLGGSDWKRAVAADEKIREKGVAASRSGHWKTVEFYVNSHALPLAEAVNIPEDIGATQMGLVLDEQVACDSGYCFT